MTDHPKSDLKKCRATVLVEGRHYIADAETGCWEWQLSKVKGYGRCNGGWAHRVMWVQSGRTLENSDELLHHRCENPGCINPEHLEPTDQSRHMRMHGRARSSLTEGQVVSIRERVYRGEGVQVVADEFGLTRKAIQNIVNGVKWVDVGGPVGPPAPRYCRECGTLIEGKRRHARFCCDSHRIVYNNRALTRRRRAEGLEVAA